MQSKSVAWVWLAESVIKFYCLSDFLVKSGYGKVKGLKFFAKKAPTTAPYVGGVPPKVPTVAPGLVGKTTAQATAPVGQPMIIQKNSRSWTQMAGEIGAFVLID